MTQEEKELLLRDLCGRLPYDVIVQETFQEVKKNVPIWDCGPHYIKDNLEKVKPYLRPISSMTKEEREDFWWNVLDMDWKEDLDHDDNDELESAPFPFAENGCGFYLDNYYLKDTFAVIDWLNKHHFDYRGLIEKGLALEAPEDMYK